MISVEKLREVSRVQGIRKRKKKVQSIIETVQIIMGLQTYVITADELLFCLLILPMIPQPRNIHFILNCSSS